MTERGPQSDAQLKRGAFPLRVLEVPKKGASATGSASRQKSSKKTLNWPWTHASSATLLQQPSSCVSIGEYVEIQGLLNSTDFNKCRGYAVSFIESSHRFEVKLDKGGLRKSLGFYSPLNSMAGFLNSIVGFGSGGPCLRIKPKCEFQKTSSPSYRAWLFS